MSRDSLCNIMRFSVFIGIIDNLKSSKNRFLGSLRQTGYMSKRLRRLNFCIKSGSHLSKSGMASPGRCNFVYNEMYNRAKYLKNLPLLSVLSSRNLQVVDKFRKHASFFYSQGGNVGAWVIKKHAFLFFFRLFA